MAETFAFELYPGRTLTAALYTGVTNAKELKNRLVKSELRDVALLDGSMIVSTFHFHVGAHKALEHEATGTMTTHTLHSEIVFALAPTRNITQAFKSFGVTADSTTVLALMVDAAEGKAAEVAAAVAGTATPLPADWAAIRNAAQIATVYGLAAAECESSDAMTNAVVSRMALKDL
eukprot:c22819_g1_i1.p2 GENE.c22819_g1_i1~~c22819_g1_i1.p2  ORF type:complete len:176 (-),score=30.12 c22819_g1_i1:113-640(-)